MDTQTTTPEPTPLIPPPNGVNHTKAITLPKKTKAKMTAKKGKPSAVKASSKKKAAPAKRGRAAKDELKISDMTKDELAVLRVVFTPKGPREGISLKTIEKTAFNTAEKKGTSRTRNNLRRLVKFGWVEKAERGTYRLTEKGRKRGIKD